MEPLELVLVGLAAFAGATLQSATGFGFALVAGPAAFAVIAPEESITLLIALGTVLNILIMAGERRVPSVRLRESAVVLAWATPGVVAGILILIALPKPTLQVIVGVAILAAVVVQLRRGLEAAGANRVAQAVAGFAAGTLTTTTATAGPPLVLYLERAGATPREFRDSMAAMLLGLNIMGGVALVLAGNRAVLPGLAALGILVGCVVAGGAAGRRIFDRLDPQAFRVGGLTLIVASALASIAAGVAS
jgi:uncharacterized membrane protein YfcA